MGRIKNIDGIWYKALQCTVIKKGDGLYEVASPSNTIYDVKIEGDYTRECNCMSGQHNPISGCTHVMAASIALVRERGYEPIWPVPVDYDWRSQKADDVFRLGQGIMLMIARSEEKGETDNAYDWFDSF